MLERLRKSGSSRLFKLRHVYTVCLPISIGGFILAPQLIAFGFGAGYDRSILTLQVLIWCVPLSVLRLVPWAALIARDRQNLLLRAMIYSVVANIILNIMLIPKYGTLGAAIATVVTESLTGVLLFKYVTHQELPLVSLQRLWRPTVASFFMTAALVVLKPSNLGVSLSLGVSVYTLVLMATGAIRLRRGQLPALDV